jgi:hypothetical protein
VVPSGSPIISKKSFEDPAVNAFIEHLKIKEARNEANKVAEIAKKEDIKKATLAREGLLARGDIQSVSPNVESLSNILTPFRSRSVPSSLDPAAQALKVTTPWAVPTGRVITNVKHAHFQIDVGSQGNGHFQDFLIKKENAPILNGKRYVANRQQSPTATPRLLTPDQKENASAKLSPKATVFMPKNSSPNKFRANTPAFVPNVAASKPARKLSPEAAEFTPSVASSTSADLQEPVKDEGTRKFQEMLLMNMKTTASRSPNPAEVSKHLGVSKPAEDLKPDSVSKPVDITMPAEILKSSQSDAPQDGKQSHVSMQYLFTKQGNIRKVKTMEPSSKSNKSARPVQVPKSDKRDIVPAKDELPAERSSMVSPEGRDCYSKLLTCSFHLCLEVPASCSYVSYKTNLDTSC